MTCRAVSCCFGLLLCSVIPASAQFVPRFISGPNEYFFTSNTYTAEPGATNVAVTVGFHPGDPSWTGSVGFTTQDGSATAGSDYTAVSGTLWFSGPAWQTFNVPLHPSNSPEDKTVALSLFKTEANSIISTPSATLIIRGAPAPVLAINHCASDTIQLIWPAAYTNYVVETTALQPGISQQQWTGMNAPIVSNGCCVVAFKMDQEKRFFRLRQAQ